MLHVGFILGLLSIQLLGDPIPDLTDEKIQQFFKQHPKGIFYAWSPHMPLSYHALPLIESVAKEFSLPVLYGLDPHSNWKSAKKAVKPFANPERFLARIESFTLYEQGIGNHYPTLLFFSKGKGQRILPGLHSLSTYQEFIRHQINSR